MSSSTLTITIDELRMIPYPSDTKNKSNIKAYQRGYTAALLGQPRESNPNYHNRRYTKLLGYRFYQWWDKGYLQAVKDNENKKKVK